MHAAQPSQSPFEAVHSRVVASPHYRILILPSGYEADRIPANRQLEEIVRVTKVNLRGMEFPALGDPRDHLQFGRDYLEAVADWERDTEIWRFYRSGQFAGVFKVHFWLGEGMVEYEDLVYSVTEFFEFGSRLVRRLNLISGVEYDFSLRNALGLRVMQSRVRRPTDACCETEVSFGGRLDFPRAATRHRHEALIGVAKLLKAFGGAEVRPDILRQTQNEYYSLNLGSDRLPPDDYDWGENSASA